MVGDLELVRAVGLLITTALLAVAVRAMRGGAGRGHGVTLSAGPFAPHSASTLSSPLASERGAAPVTVRARVPGPGVAGLRAELRHGDQRPEVRLVGSRILPTGWTWLPHGERPPPAALPVVLGRWADQRLHVDLAAAPDVVTIIGPLAACRRLVLAYARQLRAKGVDVMVVAPALAGLASCANPNVVTWSQLLSDSVPRSGVVICHRLVGTELVAARKLLAQTDGRLVPVIIGPIPRSRWSIRVDCGQSTVEECLRKSPLSNVARTAG